MRNAGTPQMRGAVLSGCESRHLEDDSLMSLGKSVDQSNLILRTSPVAVWFAKLGQFSHQRLRDLHIILESS